MIVLLLWLFTPATYYRAYVPSRQCQGNSAASENCLASGEVAIATLREDKQFAARENWSGVVRRYVSPIY